MQTLQLYVVLHCENRDFRPFCSYDLDLDPMTFLYELDLYPYRMSGSELAASRLLKVVVRETQTGTTAVSNQKRRQLALRSHVRPPVSLILYAEVPFQRHPEAARATNTQQTWRQEFLGSRSSTVERSSTQTAAAGTFLLFLQTIFENTSLWRLKRLVSLPTYRRYINKCIYLSIYLSLITRGTARSAVSTAMNG